MNSKRQRTATRRCVTTTIRQIQECLSDVHINDNDAKAEGLSALLRTKQKELELLDTQILEEVNEEDVDAEVDGANEYQSNIYVCLAEVEKTMKNLHVSPTPPRSTVSDDDEVRNLNIAQRNGNENHDERRYDYDEHSASTQGNRGRNLNLASSA